MELAPVNVTRLKECLSFLSAAYPFADETQRNEFALLLTNIDVVDEVATPEEAPVDASPPMDEVFVPVDLPTNPAQDNPPSNSTANEIPAPTPVENTNAAGSVISVSDLAGLSDEEILAKVRGENATTDIQAQ